MDFSASPRIDIWDFSDQSHKAGAKTVRVSSFKLCRVSPLQASLSDTGASVAITSMMFCYHGPCLGFDGDQPFGNVET